MRTVLLSLTLACAMAVAALAEMRMVSSPGDGFLNLRTGPGTRYQIILPMPHGSTVELFETSGNWGRVLHEESGATGWAYLPNLLPYDGAVPYLQIADPKDGWLNLRTGPGTQFQVILRMYNGSWVEVLEQQGNWVRVRHQPSGAEGWAYRPYMHE